MSKLEERVNKYAFYMCSKYMLSERVLYEKIHAYISRKVSKEEFDDKQIEYSALARQVVEKCVGYGFVNDGAYVGAKARSGERSGRSLRDVRQRLGQAGVGALILATMKRLLPLIFVEERELARFVRPIRIVTALIKKWRHSRARGFPWISGAK